MTSRLMPPAGTHWAEARDLVRQADKDRYLATLFAPEPARRHLFALYAFNVEIARVREMISEPMPGEVRYQWWRDVMMGTARGIVVDHPIAHALLDTIQACKLPVKTLLDVIEARTFDLYDDPMPSINSLEGYCGETSSALIQLAAMCLTGGRDPGTAEAAGHGGVAYAIAGLLRALPYHARRGQCFLPVDLLARHGSSQDDVVSGRVTPGLLATLAALRGIARDHLRRAVTLVAQAPQKVRPAFLPLALVPAYLEGMERRGYHPFERLVEVPQYLRQWILWRQAGRGWPA